MENKLLVRDLKKHIGLNYKEKQENESENSGYWFPITGEKRKLDQEKHTRTSK